MLAGVSLSLHSLVLQVLIGSQATDIYFTTDIFGQSYLFGHKELNVVWICLVTVDPACLLDGGVEPDQNSLAE